MNSCGTHHNSLMSQIKIRDTKPTISGGSKGGAGGAPAPPNFLISMLITVAKT